MTSIPAAAILIPVYNAEKYVSEAIESALAQRGVSIEVIVIDDGSTDETLKQLKRFDSHIKWETGPNRGAPVARNRALSLSSAPWIQYLDADDYLLPDKIALQLEILKECPSAEVIYGPSTIEWHRNGVVNTRVEPIPSPRDAFTLLASWKLPQTGAVLFKRDALIAAGSWKEDQPCCQEHELYLRMLMTGCRFFYHDAGGSIYRRFESGTLSTSNMHLVRSERRKIEDRLECFLRARNELTADRLQAINQARFEMARSAWPEDASEARSIFAEIVGRSFRPNGPAAPLSYRMAYKLGGFSFAERLAAVRRSVPL